MDHLKTTAPVPPGGGPAIRGSLGGGRPAGLFGRSGWTAPRKRGVAGSAPTWPRALAEKQFQSGLDGLGAGEEAAVQAAGALLSYLYETQKTDLGHISPLYLLHHGAVHGAGSHRPADPGADRDDAGQGEKGSLLWVLDKTRTAMGGRLIRGEPDGPLLSPRPDLPAAAGGGRFSGEQHHPPGAVRRPAGGDGSGAAHWPGGLWLRRGPGPVSS